LNSKKVLSGAVKNHTIFPKLLTKVVASS